MVTAPQTETVAKGAAVGGGGFLAGDAMQGGGLDIAARMAGGVLRGIFGGLPWQLSPQSIVDAVVPGVITALPRVAEVIP